MTPTAFFIWFAFMVIVCALTALWHIRSERRKEWRG
jgi:heme exporter protein D